MLGAVTAYTCPADKSICYSVNSSATHEIFKQLQTQINRFSSAAGFTPLAVDGLIGDKTAAAAAKAMANAISRVPDGGLRANLITFKPFSASRQLIAPMADAIGSALAEAAQLLGVSATPPPAPAPSPSPSPSTGPLAPFVPPGALSPGGPGFWAQRTTTEKAIMGIGAASALGTLVILLLPKRKKKA